MVQVPAFGPSGQVVPAPDVVAVQEDLRHRVAADPSLHGLDLGGFLVGIDVRDLHVVSLRFERFEELHGPLAVGAIVPFVHLEFGHEVGLVYGCLQALAVGFGRRRASASRIYGLGLHGPVPGFATRMDRIVGSATVEIANLVAQERAAGKDIIGLSLGEPDFDTPAHVRQAAKDALDAGHTHYTPGPGIMPLREAIATYHRDENGIPCEASNVLATPTKQAVMMAFLATVGEGDEVLLPDPGWVSYAPITQWAHATPVPVGLSAETGFRMTPEAVAEAITPASRMIVINSPSNPTGGTNTRDDVKGIVELAEDHDLWIVSDEIYQQLRYGSDHVSAASFDGAFERTITLDGLSKSFAMTGWRTGWAVAPTPAFKQMNKLQSHSITHVTSFAQYGALAALTGPQDCVAEMRDVFAKRRRLVLDAFNDMDGVTCPEPGGAFYVFPKFEGVEDDGAFTMRMIKEAGVAGTPGSAFGEAGRGHVRFSYAASEEKLRTAMERIQAFVN